MFISQRNYKPIKLKEMKNKVQIIWRLIGQADLDLVVLGQLLGFTLVVISATAAATIFISGKTIHKRRHNRGGTRSRRVDGCFPLRISIFLATAAAAKLAHFY